MAKNCKHFNSISRCAVLLMIAAGASAAAKDVPAEGAPAVNPAVQKVITDETALRTQILADIETQKKYAEKLTEDEKFSEAEATFKALLQQLAAIPGTEAKIKYEKIVKAQKKLHRKWAADILAKAHDLFDAKNYNEAIRVCSIINSFDAEDKPVCNENNLIHYYRFDTDDLYIIEETEDEKEEEEEESVESSTSNSGENIAWLQITSILVAVALFGALIAVIVRKAFADRLSKKKKTEKYYHHGYDKTKRYTKSSDVAVPDADDIAEDYDYGDDEDSSKED